MRDGPAGNASGGVSNVVLPRESIVSRWEYVGWVTETGCTVEIWFNDSWTHAGDRVCSTL